MHVLGGLKYSSDIVDSRVKSNLFKKVFNNFQPQKHFQHSKVTGLI